MPESNGPQIQPQVMPFGGEGIALIADADPGRFPLGLEVVVYEPGNLVPLGRVPLPRACMLAVVPPGMSENIRREIRKHVAKQAKEPGKSAPPGLPG